MKNLKELSNHQTRKIRGGSMTIAGLIIWGAAIAAPYVGIAYDWGTSIGQAIVNRRR